MEWCLGLNLGVWLSDKQKKAFCMALADDNERVDPFLFMSAFYSGYRCVHWRSETPVNARNVYPIRDPSTWCNTIISH